MLHKISLQKNHTGNFSKTDRKRWHNISTARTDFLQSNSIFGKIAHSQMFYDACWIFKNWV